jgi:hypothetical protein
MRFFKLFIIIPKTQNCNARPVFNQNTGFLKNRVDNFQYLIEKFLVIGNHAIPFLLEKINPTPRVQDQIRCPMFIP